MTETQDAPGFVADAERLDRLLSEIGDKHDLPILYEDCRRLLHGVIVELERLQRSETALTATIRAYPDAVANAAANLAHARAQRDEMTTRVTELRGEVKELYAKLAELDAENNSHRIHAEAMGRSHLSIDKALGTARATNDRLNRRAQEFEKQLAAVKRQVDKWSISERGCYVPLDTIPAIAKQFGLEIDDSQFEMHYQRLEAVEAERDQARAQVADYENRITWDTTCGQCATVLDSCIAEYERRERAETALAAVRALAEKWAGEPTTIERFLANSILKTISDAAADQGAKADDE